MTGKGTSFDGGPIGYKRPPAAHQFKKGQKPPASGRRRASKNVATLIEDAMESKVTVNENGKKRRMPAKQALIKRAIARAMGGNVNDVLRLFVLFERFAPQVTNSEPPVLVIRTIQGDEDE